MDPLVKVDKSSDDYCKLLQSRIKGSIEREYLRINSIKSLTSKLKDLEKLKTMIPPSKLVLPPKCNIYMQG